MARRIGSGASACAYDASLALPAGASRVQPGSLCAGAGAFALAKGLRGDAEPFFGAIVIVLERKQNSWLAEWSGADAWFVKPVDPFELADRVLEIVSAKEIA